MSFYQDADPQALNTMFLAKLGSDAGISDLQRVGAAFVRDRLRELGFLRRIIPPEYVHPDDLDRDERWEAFRKVVDIEPDSVGITMTWRGDGDGEYVFAKRAALLFGTVASKRFSKKISELRTYEMPITKIIEDNTIRDVQEQEDLKFVRQIERAVLSNASGTHRVVFRNTIDENDHPIVDRKAITFTAAQLAGNERRPTTILMSDADILKFIGEDAAIIGDDLASKITVQGWEYKNLFGFKLIPSVKSVSRTGTAFNDGGGTPANQVANTIQGVAPMDVGRWFMFTDPEYLGKFYILEEANFYIERRFGTVAWQHTEEIAAGLVNTGSVAMCDHRLRTPGTGANATNLWPAANPDAPSVGQVYNHNLIT